jgi:hypothetical protein
MMGGGAPRNPRLTALWTAAPIEAAAEVRRALEDHSTIEQAATFLHVGPRTLYRWMGLRRTHLQKKGMQQMKPRELRGAINRAKVIYALVQYNGASTFHAKISKGAAREIADAANDVEDGQKPEDIVAEEDSGDLYIGYLPAGVTTKDSEEEGGDDE